MDRRALAGQSVPACRALRLVAAAEASITEVGADVVVGTPTRIDHLEGNVVDLVAAPKAEDVPAVLARVRRMLDPFGAAHAHVRWEQPVGTGDPVVAAELMERGFLPRTTLVFERGARVAVDPADGSVALVRLPAPGQGVDAVDVITLARWHAADELQRFASIGGGDVWQRWDAAGVAWDRERVRALARLGRADVWLTTVHDEPVATLAVLRDGRGLALLADLVVHPAHRGRGHGTALLDAVTAAEHASAPGTRVFAEIDPGGAAEHMWRRDGAVVIAEVVAAVGQARTDAPANEELAAPA